MIKWLGACWLLLAVVMASARADVLIVADEFPAMEVLAAKLKSEEHLASKVVSQRELPEQLAGFSAVIVYIHKALEVTAENAFIDYARAGGKLVVLHHSISSGKRTNEHWFSFLGVALPLGDVGAGGYKWIEPASFDLVNLNPAHFVMTNRLVYPALIAYTTTNAPARAGGLPGFHLPDTEVYLNHVHTGPHTLLMGLKYTNPETGVTYQQDTAGWIKPAGKGWVMYFIPGHRAEDFENPVYARIVLNTVIYQP